MVSYLYPKISLKTLPTMLGFAVLGAVVAGVYGIVHDQITYSISSEFFTRLKFQQFHWADLGGPPRLFVAEIGFLATWWVGFFAAWFLTRVTVRVFSPKVAFRHAVCGFLIVFAAALGAANVGNLLGCARTDFSAWEGLGSTMQVRDLPNFVRVAYIHNAGYLGGLIGSIAAIVYVRRCKPSISQRQSVPAHRLDAPKDLLFLIGVPKRQIWPLLP
jgi:hypothetical protein